MLAEGALPRQVWTPLNPTVCLDIILLMTSSCGYDSGQIAQLVARSLVGHGATHGEPAERSQHRHQQHVQPVAPVRQRQDQRPRLTPRGFTHHAPPSDAGQPYGHTREEP